MATNANRFVVNLVDLQNIALSITGNATGQPAIQQLQTDVGNLQNMVDYDTKSIYADSITEFTSGHGVTINNASLTTTNTVSNTVSNTQSIQGSMAFVYTLTGVAGFSSVTSGSLPASFVSSVIASGTILTLVLQSTYSISYIPNYFGTITWYSSIKGGYSSFTLPNSNVLFTGSQITITIPTTDVPTITPDSSGYSLWLSLTIFN